METNRIKVYLSLPITGLNLNERRQCAARMSAKLTYEHQDWDVINPFHVYDRLKAELLSCADFSEPHYDDILAADLAVLGTCKKAYFLQGWQQSNGCQREMAFCRDNNIEVIFDNPNS